MFLTQKIKEFTTANELDLTSMNVMFLGVKYHEIPVSNICITDKWQQIDINEYDYRYDATTKSFKLFSKENDEYCGIFGHEYPIGWYDVVGSIDDLVIMNDEIFIVDKKTASKIPDYIYPNYKKQLEYYAVCLTKMHPNEEFNKGAILYIKNIVKTQFALGSNYHDIDVDKSTEEFIRKVDTTKECLKINIIPKSNKNNWDCRFCKFKDLCAKIGELSCDWDDEYIKYIE
jgi:CRISPR/Cas system-associated exonuclease Cas4 (RecB family)